MEIAQAVNPIKSLLNFGQSVWLDYIRRDMLINGELSKLIKDDGLRGMTSNPAIFQKAIGTSTDYDQAIKSLVKENLEASLLYEKLAVEDVQKAADLFRPVYDQTKRLDGYVSLEVSPYLALDTKATVAEAKRLWQEVNRPNVMIKVPGTAEGIQALEELIGSGINVNVTLLFSKNVYEKVAKTYIKGLEHFASKGGDVSKVASVASFFISRIDSAVDKAITEKIQTAKDESTKKNLNNLLGKIAIANAKVTYHLYKELISQPNWQALAKKGAMPQRLLWASTSTKNPKYRDVYYVEELIGPETVNTIPPATYDAFRDHGKAAKTLEMDLEAAKTTLNELEKAGISLEAICKQLVTDAIKLFSDPFDQLLATLKSKYAQFGGKGESTSTNTEDVKKKLLEWGKPETVKKLWAGDSKLWTGEDEGAWLGWLKIVDEQISQLSKFKNLVEDVNKAKFKQILLIGMGGSSLGPAVLAAAFGKIAGYPEFHMIDSTVPEQIKAVEEKLDLSHTLFIVSSKSGSTLEPNILKDYFFDKVKAQMGAEKAAKQFIAITDPGSHMEKVAKSEGFRHIFYGLTSIGGRYSVLSDFGMIPAAVMGIDLSRFLDRAKSMMKSCAPDAPLEKNEGLALGQLLGREAGLKKDKVTFIVSPAIAELGAWLEQLLAESTGKSGKGIIPIDKENLGDSSDYGQDRVFIYIRLKNQADPSQDKDVEKLEKAGFTVFRISVNDVYDLAAEFFRFEFATAVAGSIMAINPFNQPDVEASKIKTRAITDDYEKTGKLKTEAPILSLSNTKPAMDIYTDENNWKKITKITSAPKSLTEVLGAFINDVGKGDYFAILAYIAMNETNRGTLQKIRMLLRNHFKTATCLGFGPRYLHSTGQVYKGGPNSGIFLEITADDSVDVPVPGKNYTFAVVKNAQAIGDYQVLCERKRRVIRLHIKGNLNDGLSAIQKAVEEVCRAKI